MTSFSTWHKHTQEPWTVWRGDCWSGKNLLKQQESLWNPWSENRWRDDSARYMSHQVRNLVMISLTNQCSNCFSEVKGIRYYQHFQSKRPQKLLNSHEKLWEGPLELGMNDVDFFSLQITNKNLLLLVYTDYIIDDFTLLYFNKKFLTCRLCTPEGNKGSDILSKDGWFNILHSSSPLCLLVYHRHNL